MSSDSEEFSDWSESDEEESEESEEEEDEREDIDTLLQLIAENKFTQFENIINNFTADVIDRLLNTCVNNNIDKKYIKVILQNCYNIQLANAFDTYHNKIKEIFQELCVDSIHKLVIIGTFSNNFSLVCKILVNNKVNNMCLRKNNRNGMIFLLYSYYIKRNLSDMYRRTTKKLFNCALDKLMSKNLILLSVPFGLDIVKKAISKGANINYVNPTTRNNALILSSKYNDRTVFNYLYDNYHFDLNYYNKNFETVYNVASEQMKDYLLKKFRNRIDIRSSSQIKRDYNNLLLSKKIENNTNLPSHLMKHVLTEYLYGSKRKFKFKSKKNRPKSKKK